MLAVIATMMFLIGLPGLLVGLFLTVVGLFAKPIRKILIVGLFILSLSAFSVLFGYYEQFVNMRNLPEGTKIAQSQSPNRIYALRIYLDSGGGATGEPAIRVEVINHNKHNQQRNIYWAPDEDHVTVHWIDNETVSINGHVLSAQHGTYDARHNPWF